MPTATILRRSLVRGVVGALLMALAASTAITEDPVELHVIGRRSHQEAPAAGTVRQGAPAR